MSRSEHGLVLGLEQQCIRPGVWLIEGYDVKRRESTRGRNYRWGVLRDGFILKTTRTLGEAREWIRDQLDR